MDHKDYSIELQDLSRFIAEYPPSPSDVGNNAQLKAAALRLTEIANLLFADIKAANRMAASHSATTGYRSGPNIKAILDSYRKGSNSKVKEAQSV